MNSIDCFSNFKFNYNKYDYITILTYLLGIFIIILLINYAFITYSFNKTSTQNKKIEQKIFSLSELKKEYNLLEINEKFLTKNNNTLEKLIQDQNHIYNIINILYYSLEKISLLKLSINKDTVIIKGSTEQKNILNEIIAKLSENKYINNSEILSIETKGTEYIFIIKCIITSK